MLLGPDVDLSSQDFTTLTNPTLNGVVLWRANLAGSDFSTSDLSNADLRATNLSNTNLSGANLTNAYLNDLASSRGLALPNGFSIINRPAGLNNGPPNTVVGPGISLYGFDFSNWNLTGINAPGANFTNVNFTNTNLTNANLSGANLNNVTMSNTNVSNTNLSMVTQGNYSRFTVNWGWAGQLGATLPPVDYTCPSGYVVSANAGGKNDGIPGMEALGLRCVQVINGVTSLNSQFIQVLSNYSMSNNIPYWSECGSNQAAVGIQAAFDGNRVQNTGPTCAVFPTGALANSPAMSLTDNGLNDGGRYGKYATGAYTCPPGQWLVGIQAQRSVSDTGSIYMINQIICQQWNQIQANGLVSTGLIGNPILGVGWTLYNGQLVGPGVNLSGVNLTGANLSRVNFTGTNLSGTNLSNANLDYVNSKGIIGTPTLPSGYFMVAGGYLLGPKVALMGADLRNLDLSNKQLWQATFVNSDLSGSNLSYANLNDAYFDSSAIVTNVSFYNASMIRTNLSWKDLSSNNLSGANLYGGILNRTTLNGGSNRGSGNSPNMNNTNLSGATITNSNLTGNLSTVNFTGNTSYGDGFTQWLLFPGPANYRNGQIYQ